MEKVTRNELAGELILRLKTLFEFPPEYNNFPHPSMYEARYKKYQERVGEVANALVDLWKI